ncbi:MAG: hypothetical protein P4L31_02910 [Candidatus Babeliales bacterium]|nr:hypothetical protein [Candidatus Babeliales bacterium]
MKRYTSYFLSNIFLIVLMHNTALAAMQAVPYFSIRPQGVDAARELMGWTRAINQYDTECAYGSVSLTAQYNRSFNGIDIAKSLMLSVGSQTNSCGFPFFTIAGSQQFTPRSPFDMLAENFYLPPDFNNLINIQPLIENVIVDIDFYMGLDNWLSGLFFQINAPINFSRWSLRVNPDDQNIQLGTSGYAPGYFNNDGVDRSLLLNSFSDYWSGKVPFGATGVTFNPLCYAKVEGCSGNESVTRLAELAAIVGWNFIDRQRGHLGVGALMRAPTGNRPTARLLFEPISGNGGHWELGAHITSHYTFFECDANSLGFYIDANITHLFNARQTRTFDLIGKPLSRYMLAQKLGTPVANLTGSDSSTGPGTTTPSAQFQHIFSPVANLTTRTLKVSAAVQADIAAQFTYSAGDGFSADIGYNFWARSCDKFSFDKCIDNSACPTSCRSSASCSSPACAATFAPDTWALKGDAYVIGFDTTTATPTPVALSATESGATIYSGTNFPITGANNSDLTPAQSNVGIDNREFAFTIAGNPLFGTTTGDAGTQTRTSIEPVFIKESDINFAGTRGMSHKIYTHLSYTWLEGVCGTPFIGIGGFGEFGVNASDCNDSTSCPTSCPESSCAQSCPSSCASSCSDSCSMVTTTSSSCNTSSCTTASLSQWGAWIKMGTSF